jgi:hypothetical protein
VASSGISVRNNIRQESQPSGGNGHLQKYKIHPRKIEKIN